MEGLLLMATLFWGVSFVWCKMISDTGVDTNAYVAIYKIIDNTVYIYRVVNGKTNYPRLLK